MSKKYEDDGEIETLVQSFENATIGRDEWKHAEHLVVALYYLSKHDIETGRQDARRHFNLLREAFKVDLTKEMPYHER